MKKIILSLFLITSFAGILKAQETPPAGLKSVNAQFYINLSDSAIWHNKGTAPNGTVYGWERVARYAELITVSGNYKLKSDTVAATGYVRNWYLTNQLSLKANLNGGNAFIGNQTITGNGSNGFYFGYGTTGGGYGALWSNPISSKVLNNAGLVLYDGLTSLQSNSTGTVEVNINGNQKFAVTNNDTYVANNFNVINSGYGLQLKPNVATASGRIYSYDGTHDDSSFALDVNASVTNINGKSGVYFGHNGNTDLTLTSAGFLVGVPLTYYPATGSTANGILTVDGATNEVKQIPFSSFGGGTTTNALTLGYGLLGGSFNGSAAITAKADSGELVNKTYFNGKIGTGVATALSGKQATLVSGTNIKTINGTTLLGSGNLAVGDALLSGSTFTGVTGVSATGDIDFFINSTTNAPYLNFQKNGVDKFYWLLERNTPAYGMSANDIGLIRSGQSAPDFYVKQSNGDAVFNHNVSITGTVGASNLSGTNTGDQTSVTGNAGTVTDIGILTGDITSVNRATTLATVNPNIGTFNNVTVNGKGLVTSASNVSYLTGNQSISFAPTGDVTGSASGATSLAPALSIGSGKVTNAMLAGSIDLTTKVTGLLPNANINSVAWSKITSTPTTISGYGITDFNSLGDARWLQATNFTTSAINALYGYTPANPSLYLPLTAGIGQPLTGTLYSGMGNNSVVAVASSATTGYQYQFIQQSTGGYLYSGVERSAGSLLLTGATGYSGVIATGNTTNLSLGTNGIERVRIDGTTGTLNLSATPATGSSADMVLVRTSGGDVKQVSAAAAQGVVASGDLTTQTTTQNVFSYTAGSGVYRAGAYISNASVSSGNISVKITYTNPSNVSITEYFYNQGSTSQFLTSVNNTSFPTFDFVPKPGTTVTATITITGTTTYSGGATLQQLR